MSNKSKCDFLLKDGCCAIAGVASYMSLPDENFSTIKYIVCKNNRNCYFKQRNRYIRFIQKMYKQLLHLIEKSKLIGDNHYIRTDAIRSSVEPYIRSVLYKAKNNKQM